MYQKLICAAAIASAMFTSASAETDLGQVLNENGLERAEAMLASQGTLSPSDQFALGGVQFLRAMEKTLQGVYALQLDLHLMRELDLPFLRRSQNADLTPRPLT